jgi:hypothetical protein
MVARQCHAGVLLREFVIVITIIYSPRISKLLTRLSLLAFEHRN